jgi:type II secretory ATPase GspE/PulE/Tfp pilus assembly ATPase PilB-like protein
MPITDPLRAMVTERASARDIRKQAVIDNMKSLREDGWRLVRQGITTVEEVLRVTKDERATLDINNDKAGAAAGGGS